MINPKTVTVVGANGTMGANVSAIFASFGNARVYIGTRGQVPVPLKFTEWVFCLDRFY